MHHGETGSYSLGSTLPQTSDTDLHLRPWVSMNRLQTPWLIFTLAADLSQPARLHIPLQLLYLQTPNHPAGEWLQALWLLLHAPSPALLTCTNCGPLLAWETQEITLPFRGPQLQLLQWGLNQSTGREACVKVCSFLGHMFLFLNTTAVIRVLFTQV